MKTVIALETISKVKDFVEIARTFESNIDIGKGHYVIDGKSILGILSIDASKGVDVEIHSTDENELRRFAEEIKQFEVGA